MVRVSLFLLFGRPFRLHQLAKLFIELGFVVVRPDLAGGFFEAVKLTLIAQC